MGPGRRGSGRGGGARARGRRTPAGGAPGGLGGAAGAQGAGVDVAGAVRYLRLSLRCVGEARRASVGPVVVYRGGLGHQPPLLEEGLAGRRQGITLAVVVQVGGLEGGRLARVLVGCGARGLHRQAGEVSSVAGLRLAKSCSGQSALDGANRGGRRGAERGPGLRLDWSDGVPRLFHHRLVYGGGRGPSGGRLRLGIRLFVRLGIRLRLCMHLMLYGQQNLCWRLRL